MLKEILTVSLQESKEIQALTESFDTVLSEIFQKIPNVLIYSRIDTLSEEVIDLLAWQFHIEGYELAETEEEKRALVKKAIELHRYKGTRWAIKKVLELLNMQGVIKEWFEYGGEPYKFKVDLSLSNKEITTAIKDKLINLINEYKNERSWLEEIALSYFTKAFCYVSAKNMAEAAGYSEMIDGFTWISQAVGYVSAGVLGEATAVAIAMEV